MRDYLYLYSSCLLCSYLEISAVHRVTTLINHLNAKKINESNITITLILLVFVYYCLSLSARWKWELLLLLLLPFSSRNYCCLSVQEITAASVQEIQKMLFKCDSGDEEASELLWGSPKTSTASCHYKHADKEKARPTVQGFTRMCDIAVSAPL